MNSNFIGNFEREVSMRHSKPPESTVNLCSAAEWALAFSSRRNDIRQCGHSTIWVGPITVHSMHDFGVVRIIKHQRNVLSAFLAEDAVILQSSDQICWCVVLHKWGRPFSVLKAAERVVPALI